MYIELLVLIFKCIIAFLFLTIFVIYLYFKYQYSFWRKRNVPGPEPRFPFGTLRGVSKEKHFSGMFDEIYRKYKHLKYVGIYNLHMPVLMINDLELIKDVLLRKYEHFSSHGLSQDFELNPLSNNLFIQDGEKWKHMRTKLSPIFTSNKLKLMLKVMSGVQKSLKEYLHLEVKKSKKLNIKKILSCYTIDVIAKCVYSIELNSFKNPNNQLKVAAKEITDPSNFIKKVQLLLTLIVPKLAEFLRFSSQSPEFVDYFSEIVKTSMKLRDEKNIKTDDFLQYMIDLKNNDDDNSDILFTTEDIIPQTFMFIGAGFDTTANTSSFCLLELAANPEIQDKTIEEIQCVLKKYSGELTYDALHEMNYLTMVIEETLRLHPPTTVLVRKCTMDYRLDDNYTVEEGTMVFIPSGGIHGDPEIYPEPEKFDPERFNPKEKGMRDNYHYLPFGEGPRLCIGLRFALMQVKVAVLTILSNYKVKLTENSSTTKVASGPLIQAPALDELEFIPLNQE